MIKDIKIVQAKKKQMTLYIDARDQYIWACLTRTCPEKDSHVNSDLIPPPSLLCYTQCL